VGALALIAGAGCSAGRSGSSADGVCSYPAGPYGSLAGQTVDPGLTWRGYQGDARTPSTVSVEDYLDCDGSKGIRALVVDQSAAWCDVCQGTAAELDAEMQGSWIRSGVRVLMLVTEAVDRTPATVETAKVWHDRYGGDGITVVADPGYAFRDTAGERLAPLPYRLLVDPRTMEILDIDVGAPASFDDVLSLVEKNDQK
jgi:hypothetical protein